MRSAATSNSRKTTGKDTTGYKTYHKRYYQPVTWVRESATGPMTHQGFRFAPRRFKTLPRAKQEAVRFGASVGQSVTLLRLPDGRFTFLPSSQQQDIAIERMCRLLGAKVVDCVTVWSL